MPHGTVLTPYEAGQVDAYKAEGKSNNYIASTLNRSTKAIRTYLSNKATYFQKHANGAKSLLSEGDKRQLIRDDSATGDSAKAAKQALGLTAYESTVLRALRATDTLKYAKAKVKPKLTPRHKADRLLFAKVHMTWQLE